jgi:hypothetical protein
MPKKQNFNLFKEIKRFEEKSTLLGERLKSPNSRVSYRDVKTLVDIVNRGDAVEIIATVSFLNGYCSYYEKRLRRLKWHLENNGYARVYDALLKFGLHDMQKKREESRKLIEDKRSLISAIQGVKLILRKIEQDPQFSAFLEM